MPVRAKTWAMCHVADAETTFQPAANMIQLASGFEEAKSSHDRAHRPTRGHRSGVSSPKEKMTFGGPANVES
jgi:hypothetical protein